MNKLVLSIFLLLSLSSCKNEMSQFATFYVNYDYGGVLCSSEGEPKITVLYNSSYFNFDLNDYEIPNNLVPGDSITIEYTGDLYTLTSYPGQIVLNGDLLDLKIEYTKIVEIEETNIIKDQEGNIESLYSYTYYDNYVVLDENLNYIELSKYQGDTLYGSYNPINNNEDSQSLSALFAFNPRS